MRVPRMVPQPHHPHRPAARRPQPVVCSRSPACTHAARASPGPPSTKKAWFGVVRMLLPSLSATATSGFTPSSIVAVTASGRTAPLAGSSAST